MRRLPIGSAERKLKNACIGDDLLCRVCRHEILHYCCQRQYYSTVPFTVIAEPTSLEVSSRCYIMSLAILVVSESTDPMGIDTSSHENYEMTRN